MGAGNCGFGISMEKDPLLGGDAGKRILIREFARNGSEDDDDEGYAGFQEWLTICEDVTQVWKVGWALATDGPMVATPELRTAMIGTCEMDKSMARIDLGSQELDVASQRPRKLANEFGGRDSERQAQRRVVAGGGNDNAHRG